MKLSEQHHSKCDHVFDDQIPCHCALAEVRKLEAELSAHLENEGDECPLCAAEDKVTALEAEKAQWQKDNVQLHEENERLLYGLRWAHLHLEASWCDCGEPLKKTDAFDSVHKALFPDE